MSLTLLSACVRENFSITPMPEMVHYGSEFQKRAREELRALPRVCLPMDTVTKDCSAIKMMIVDYGHLRQQIKAIRRD
jgi:hypothetical protein